MQSHASPATKTIDLDAIERFWERESRRMAERNAALSGAFRAAKEEIARRRAEREHVVVTCMDERAAHVDEVLGHLPGEAPVYASGGGKIDIDTFEALYGDRLAACGKTGKTARVFLVPHECSHDGRLGCAAFGNDTEAQRQFFTDLKREILERHPGARVHVLAMCTTKHDLRVIDVHAKDAHLRQVHAASSGFNPLVEDTQHAGYGIYLGDAYRAWVPGRNSYFRLSALNPDIAGNAAIALKVMGHHSDVDLSTKPVVLHADYPAYADAVWTEAARMNIDGQLNAFLSSPAAREKAAAGALKVIKTETDTETWEGKVL
jgi:hypothetical protein